MIELLTKSLTGLAILVVVSLESLLLYRKKTIPVILLDQSVAGYIVYLFFGWLTVVYSILLTAFLLFIKYKSHTNDPPSDLDYNGRIFSISAVINKLHKPKPNHTVIGRIQPVTHSELKYNQKLIEVDDIIQSGAMFITGSTGSGKNLHKDTLIPTINGMKTLDNIQVGDIIFDENGLPTKVVDKYSPKETNFYKFTFSDGTTVKAGGGHLWKVEHYKNNVLVQESNIVDSNTIYKNYKLYDIAINSIKECQYNKQDLPFEPYTLGSHLIKDPNLINTYKISSTQDRLNLLAGIIDTIGQIFEEEGYCTININNLAISKSIREICCSLGFKSTQIQKNNEIYTFNVYVSSMIPLKDEKKRSQLRKVLFNRAKQEPLNISNKFYITNIELISDNEEDYYCLAVDSPTHMFLCTESFIPTHNTTTMKTILKQRIDEQRPVVFFDYKGEEDILDEIKKYAIINHLPYYEFSARDCTFGYDPFINLNETGKVEALMNTRRWATTGIDEHYKTSMQLVIQNLIREYDQYREEKREKTNYIVGLYEFSKTYHPQSNERDGFNNLQKSLEILLSSKAQELFTDHPDFTFERNDPYVICFSFTSANKALANYISSFVYTDLMDRGTRNRYENKLLLCIDEFGTLESSTLIKDLLEKGRSGGVQTIFSILDVNQIAMNAGDHFVNAILGTINSYIIHAGATQQTADLLAGVQKYDKGYDIMSLRKPYRGKKPTALFISKYGLLDKRNNQVVVKMIPYTKVIKNVKLPKTIYTKREEVEIPEEETDHYVIPIEDLDLTQPIEHIDDYL